MNIKNLQILSMVTNYFDWVSFWRMSIHPIHMHNIKTEKLVDEVPN